MMDTTELSSSLRTLVSALHKGLRKHMSAMNTYSMTDIETIAHLLRASALLPSELAGLTHITTQSMSQILSKLESDKLIKRTPSKEDKRKVYISLTTVGKKLVEKTKHEGNSWLKGAIETSLNEKERMQLEKVLPVLEKLTSII